MATETLSIGDEWEWISNDTAEILRATVESVFTADPRKNWSAEELARWIRDVGLVSAKKNVWDHAAALGEFLVNGLGYVTGEDYMSMDLARTVGNTASEHFTEQTRSPLPPTILRMMPMVSSVYDSRIRDMS